MSIQRIKSGVIADSAVTAAKLDESTSQLFGFRNRIINGDMRIAQRGTSGTPTGGGDYVSVDRWNARAATSTGHTAAQSTTSAVGFTNSLVFTTGTGASPAAGERNWLRQSIEGFNISDLAWGTANAKTITVSFQVRSSLTGTFAAAVVSNDGNRAWPFTFTISSANTFESKSTTITGPTDGTWTSGNGVGLALSFDMGCGSNFEGTAGQWNNANRLTVSGATKVIATSGATFYITGVQLEVGSVATPFERRPYGTELALCQRYFVRVTGRATGYVRHDGLFQCFITVPNNMRTEQPSGTFNNLGIFSNFQSATASSPSAFEIGGESKAATRGFLYVSGSLGSYSSHTFIPSWESFSFDASSEL